MFNIFKLFRSALRPDKWQSRKRRKRCSKYAPHQGKRECLRRRIGGFHTQRRAEG